MLRGDPKYNKNGGVFFPGKRYELDKKMEVGIVYLRLVAEVGDDKLTITSVAEKARVSWYYANKVVKEYREDGTLQDPLVKHEMTINDRNPTRFLHVEEEIFLLSLRAEDPTRSNLDYIHCLKVCYNRDVSSSFISKWFKNRFKFSGDFKKPNLVPLDKWRPVNISKYMEYRYKMEALPLHHLWCFLDEKHIVNRDTIRMKGRANPITGKLECIAVSGDFREAYNLMAIISANPEKKKPIAYHIQTSNNTAKSFYLFIQNLIETNFFRHNEVLVMDNAAIHVGGEAKDIENLLWDTEVDGRPLRVLIIFLPTRSPELNPIELVFHILSRRIQNFRYGTHFSQGRAVVRKASQVLDSMSYELILKCYIHCGY